MAKSGSQHALFGGLALKFPLVRRSFKNVRETFIDVAGGENEISAKLLGDVMKALGAKDVSHAECQRLFKLADLDKSDAISWREFIIAVGVGYYLAEDSQGEGPNYEENRRGFKVIQDAFRRIDKDDSGEIDAQELKKALFDVSDSSSGESSTILEARFAELDVNDDSSVSFEEFLFGFISWVGLDDGLDDPDEDLADFNSQKNRSTSADFQGGDSGDEDGAEAKQEESST